LIDNALIWVAGHIVKKKVDSLFRSKSGLGLPSSYGTEGNQEFVVYCAGVVEEGTNDRGALARDLVW
jgi:hypothetical protein